MDTMNQGEFSLERNVASSTAPTTSMSSQVNDSNVYSCCTLSKNNLKDHHLYFELHETAKYSDIGALSIPGGGCILDLSMTLADICPGCRVAACISLFEVDKEGAEYPRGVQILTIPAHNNPCKTSIRLQNLRFILPDELAIKNTNQLERRHFIVRVNAHYIDLPGFTPI